MGTSMLNLEVAYTAPGKAISVSLEYQAHMTIKEAIVASGLLERYPDIDLSVNKIGRFGQLCTLEEVVQAGDRLEITRPLVCEDPKEMRRQRAKLAKANRK